MRCLVEPRSGRNQARGARVEDVVRLGNRVGRRTRPRQMRTAAVHPKLSTPSAGRTWRCICSKDLPPKGPEPRMFGGNLPPCSARAGPCRPQRPPHARSYGWTSRPRERRRARRGSQVRRSCPSRGDARSKLSGAAPRGGGAPPGAPGPPPPRGGGWGWGGGGGGGPARHETDVPRAAVVTS